MSALPRVWACVVAYHADPARLRTLVETLQADVERVVIVDNAPAGDAIASLAGPSVIYLPMARNVGTSGAMNRAWTTALEGGAQFLATFDQDSRPAQGLIARLADSFSRAEARGLPVAAVGPAKVDPRTNTTLRILRPVRWRKRYAAVADTPQSGEPASVEVDHLITSGCLISADAFRAVGPYDDRLFLDYVDIEWSLRARAKGLMLLCDPTSSMPHVIGDDVVRVGPFRVWLHQPRRNGLLVRNHVLLWRAPDVSIPWLLVDARQVAAKLLVHMVAAPKRIERVRWIAKGLADGLRGRGGPM